MADLLKGQVEVLLPELMEAIAERKAAENKEKLLKERIAELIGVPQTVKTVWGTVTLCNGKRSTKIVSKVLKSKIALMMAEGLENGDVIENIGSPYLNIRQS